MGRRTLTALTLAIAAAVATAAPAQTSRPADEAPRGAERGKADEESAALAAAVMERLGGEKAWAETRVITWVFFGSRRHVWDRKTGDIRIESLDGGMKRVVLMNLSTGNGRVWHDGKEVVDPVEVEKALESGCGAWINDSYWLVMPYKLRDPGVTLRHIGRGETEAGEAAEVLELTFERVGRTPQNKYHVFVGVESGLVEQWSFFRNADDESPAFSSPWTDWKKHGRIMLSSGRGLMRGREMRLTDIAVMDEPPPGALTDPAWTPDPVKEDAPDDGVSGDE